MKKHKARSILTLSARMVGPALRTAAAISLARKLGPRRTGRLIAFVAGDRYARSR